MALKGNYKYKSAICIDANTIRELLEVINRYFESPHFSVTFIEGSSIEYEQIEDVLKLDNYGVTKISKLSIRSGFDCWMNISVRSSLITEFESTIYMDYTVKDFDQELLLKKALDNVFNKSKQSKLYNLVSKFSFLICNTIIWIPCWIISTYNNIKYGSTQTNISILSFLTILVSVALFYTLLWGLFKLKKIAFPPLVFLWGEEIKKDRKRKEGRDFWIKSILLCGIVVGVVVGAINSAIF